MSDGVVAIAGVFEPGSVVSLIPRESDQQLRAGEFPLERRVVDEHGDVGFAGLDDGGLYFACGYLPHAYVELRVVAHLPEHVQAHLAQPTDGQAAVNKVGLDGQVLADPPPAQPDAPLESGIPEGVPYPVNVEPEPEPEPVEPDIQGRGTVPSESAGVDEGAGAPSEEGVTMATAEEQAATDQEAENAAKVAAAPDAATVEAKDEGFEPAEDLGHATPEQEAALAEEAAAAPELQESQEDAPESQDPPAPDTSSDGEPPVA